jgi:glycosyltransferase involved in cell wall biosynthesis
MNLNQDQTPAETHIAVVIPCYNHANVLRRTLEGLSVQSLKPFEVVVVDDGSSDHPETIVNEFKTRLPVTFVRFETNKGAPAARNEGARHIHAPYVLFLDADAELIPDALESFLNALIEHPEAGFAYSNFYWGYKPFRGKAFDVEALICRNYIHTSSLMRSVMFPGFDETLKKFQDWDLWLTMAKSGIKGVWVDRFLYRIEPRRKGMSHWIPGFMYGIPWERLGWMPDVIRRYREAEAVIKKKHGEPTECENKKHGIF